MPPICTAPQQRVDVRDDHGFKTRFVFLPYRARIVSSRWCFLTRGVSRTDLVLHGAMPGALRPALQFRLWIDRAGRRGCAHVLQLLHRPEPVEVTYLGDTPCITNVVFVLPLTLPCYPHLVSPRTPAPVFAGRTPFSEKNSRSLDLAPIAC